jgi:hypothetical protein
MMKTLDERYRLGMVADSGAGRGRSQMAAVARLHRQ